jgi:hypothetical protein
LSNIQSLKGFQQAKTELEEASKRLEDKRKSLEGKTRILEERARVEKLAIDRKLLLQIVEEENHTHNAAIKDLEEKIANLDLQMKPAAEIENTPSEKPSEPVQETPEPVQETSNDIDASQEMTPEPLQESEPKEPEVPQGAPKKRKRGLF